MTLGGIRMIPGASYIISRAHCAMKMCSLFKKQKRRFFLSYTVSLFTVMVFLNFFYFILHTPSPPPGTEKLTGVQTLTGAWGPALKLVEPDFKCPCLWAQPQEWSTAIAAGQEQGAGGPKPTSGRCWEVRMHMSSKSLSYVPLYHWASLKNHKFKDKIKNFKKQAQSIKS